MRQITAAGAYHEKLLLIARTLDDKAGACWVRGTFAESYAGSSKDFLILWNG